MRIYWVILSFCMLLGFSGKSQDYFEFDSTASFSIKRTSYSDQLNEWVDSFFEQTIIKLGSLDQTGNEYYRVDPEYVYHQGSSIASFSDTVLLYHDLNEDVLKGVRKSDLNDVSDSSFIVYDYNVTIGDTIDFDLDQGFGVVANIDSVEYVGVKRRRIIVDLLVLGQQFEILQGLGSGHGFMVNPKMYMWDAYLEMYCASLDGVSVYQTEPCNVQLHELNINLKVFPNPAHSEINISFDDKSIRDYNIMDLHGKQVQKGSIASTINISYLPEGIYLLEVKGDTGITIGRTKFVKE